MQALSRTAEGGPSQAGVVAAELATILYDGDDILRETRSDGTTDTYIHGPGIDEPLAREDQVGNRVYYHAGGLGSIVRMTDATGSVVASHSYDAWGNPEGSVPERYGFTGREHDAETGLIYYRARYYDPKAGRFIAEDPIGFEEGVNFYSYVDNRPTTAVDPRGLSVLVLNDSRTELTLLVESGNAIAIYPAGNITTNPNGDPDIVGSNGPAPIGRWNVNPPLSTAGRPEFGPFFFPLGEIGPRGQRLDIARQRGIGIHGGRRGPESRTQ